MPVLYLQSTPSSHGLYGEEFRRFLTLCLTRSTAFSLSRRIPPRALRRYQYPHPIEAQLEPYLCCILQPDVWFGYPQREEGQEQLVYKATEASVALLADHYNDIFLHPIDPTQARIPARRIPLLDRKMRVARALADLCFWQDNTMLVGTLSHECICETNVIDRDFAAALATCGTWISKPRPTTYIDRATLR